MANFDRKDSLLVGGRVKNLTPYPTYPKRTTHIDKYLVSTRQGLCKGPEDHRVTRPSETGKERSNRYRVGEAKDPVPPNHKMHPDLPSTAPPRPLTPPVFFELPTQPSPLLTRSTKPASPPPPPEIFSRRWPSTESAIPGPVKTPVKHTLLKSEKHSTSKYKQTSHANLTPALYQPPDIRVGPPYGGPTGQIFRTMAKAHAIVTTR